MSEFEYVMVLISLILGLGISQILIGVSSMIKKSSRVRVYVPHVLCIVVIFGIHIQEWWIEFEYSRMTMPWKFSVFTFLIIYPIILYIMARLLFPLRMKGQDIDLKAFYHRHYQKFFFFGFLMALIAIPQNMVLLGIGFWEQSGQLLMSLLLLIPVLWRTTNDWFHYGVALIMTIFGMFYVILVNPGL